MLLIDTLSKNNKINATDISNISKTIKEYLDIIQDKEPLDHLEKSAVFVAANIARKCMDILKLQNYTITKQK